MNKLILLFLLPFSVLAQTSELWRLEVKTINGSVIPVHLSIEKNDGILSVYALNGDEKMAFDKAYYINDTLHLKFDLYDLELVLHTKGDNLTGYLSKLMSDMMYRQTQFSGKKDIKERFVSSDKQKAESLASKYQITFKSMSSGNEYPAQGLFEVNDKQEVKGTFVTKTGDHHYLQGNVIADSLYLSAMGSNIYLYKAKIKGDSLIGGEYLSPFTKYADFTGVKSESYELPNPSTITYLKEGYDKFDFSFPEMNGNKLSLSDPRFTGKVTVVQIMGTWCPSCMEETLFLMDYRKTNPDLEVVGLAFERSTEPNYAFSKILRFKDRFGVDYPILIAGKEDEASEKLPQLNAVIGFPTAIIVDKKGKVRKIHTGFKGPSTGSYYEDFKKEFSAFIAELQAE